MIEPIYFNDPDALVTATYHCETDVFERLIAKGIDVNCTDESGDTALHSAAHEGWDYLALRLRDCGADPNKPNKEGDTPWDYAVFYENEGVRVILEQHGAIPQQRRSACQQRQELIDDAFLSVNAVKRLLQTINEKKPSNS
jgi:ankyrin repeat protein